LRISELLKSANDEHLAVIQTLCRTIQKLEKAVTIRDICGDDLIAQDALLKSDKANQNIVSKLAQSVSQQ
jgi:hypothetical protein